MFVDKRKKITELLESAIQNDDVVEKVANDVFEKYDQDWSEYDDAEFAKIMGIFIDKLSDEYRDRGEDYDQIEPSTRELMEEALKISESVPPVKVFDCEDPIEGIELSFNEIAGQQDVKADLLKNYIYPFTFPLLFTEKSKGILLYGPPGTGKCLDPREKVIMFDGTMKEARHVKTGDQLMGDDSTPRNVLSTCKGRDKMFKIVPNRGEPFKVNEPHILSLIPQKDASFEIGKLQLSYKVRWKENKEVKSRTFYEDQGKKVFSEAYDFYQKLKNNDEVVDIPLEEYLGRVSRGEKYKGYRVGVEWEKKDLPLDPYVLGLCMKDERYFCLAKFIDCGYVPKIGRTPEELKIIRNIVEELGFQIKKYRDCNEKEKYNFIPRQYILNSKENRLKLLAGIIDSYQTPLRNDHYEIIQKRGKLYDDIIFLARSCGLYVYEKTQFCEFGCECSRKAIINISGTYDQLREIPVMVTHKLDKWFKEKNLNRFKFTVEYLGYGDYAGFELDGNRRFLLKDFTVTHNTMLAKAATAELPNAAFFAPSAGDLRGKYEGETEKNISNVFNCAQQTIDDSSNDYDYAIIFLDEFDSIAGLRGDDPGMTRSVNALLQTMDGMKEMPNISVIAATNYPWNIDEAVLRRFSARVFIDLPDKDAIEWLLRRSLSKNYSLPNILMSERGKDMILDYDSDGTVGEWDDQIFENIEQYGYRYCPESEAPTRSMTKWLSGGEEDTVNIVDADYISKIASGRIGPNLGAMEIKKKIIGSNDKAGEYVDPDSIDDETTDIKFGYSASDVTKMMNIATQDASFRALMGGFAKQTIGDNIYYLAVPEDDDEARYVALEELAAKKLKPLTPDQKKKALNFSICRDDIETAMKKYPSTIRTSKYIQLLNYKYHSITPK